MTLYTAIGRYELSETSAGEKRPHIHVGDNEFELDVWEMIIWSSLIWNIYTFTEINREFYKKEREAHILGERSCEEYLDRMERKGLVACGHGVTGEDALRDLLERFYVIPATSNFVTKVGAFIHLSFIKKISFRVTSKIFAPPKLTPVEKIILQIVKHNLLSIGELNNYSELSSLTSTEVLSCTATLYLNKHIFLDVISQ